MLNFIIRPAQKKDLSDLLKLSRSFPLYNLPQHKKFLREKLELSGQSFQKKLPPFERNHVFVLEDLNSKEVIGSSQILSFSNKNRSYRYLLRKNQGQAYLQFVSVQTKRHQLGGLILSRRHRGLKEQLGRCVGSARLLYMKNNEKDFSKTLEVSLTGPFQKENNPFWKQTGAKYLKQNYLQALKLYRNDPDALLKKFPKKLKIELESLSEIARSSLKIVHPQTLPAYKGLIKRGFKPSGGHHLLDGGIYLVAKSSLLFQEIENLELIFKSPQLKEPKKAGSFFLIGKKKRAGFLSARVKGLKIGSRLKIEKNSFFKEGEKILSLPLN